jgi:curli production assembly/transport component CsgF
MKKLFFTFTFGILSLALFTPQAQAQDLTYQAKNPAFGGNYLNYSWMLNSAQSQNTFQDPDATSGSGFSRDPMQNFQENLNRQILNQLSQQIIRQQFGEQGLQPGEYQLGSYNVNVSEGSSGIEITIYDSSTGGTTTVVVPYY